ncbi:hypothetical protein [Bradyrhizobium diazoefficiens]|uniref:Uncharacterized protein n=1 Tax=Bradyrhizobium diazoefficiens TaxID=1355477 RepID=A0A809YIH6_9BRAD|nr:hypothetical protein [Bradyrhizobium diazoefficiens]BCA21525.1 hypothetical protein BDHH15_47400 [Bradyrhizobium diazoefficiens]BCE39694.1 hypothetical protein XF3B_47250 [Bradyrhizobium diazoefficiens]BCF53090.1 hypothetical protein XF17B_47280 [Bradyrhizobium diazoefficiens]
MSGRMRLMRADVHWLDGARDVATLTIDDNAPTLLMIDGEPFVRADVCGLFVQPGEAPRYFQVKPYRVDAGLLEGM